MIMANWEELDLTCREDLADLERIIAERLGWVNLDYIPECYGIPPNKKGKERVPFYTTDLNIAIQLEHEGFLLTLKHWTRAEGKDEWQDEWYASYYNNQKAYGIGHWGKTPALAICKAWLAVADK
jgi:hypothetical protein